MRCRTGRAGVRATNEQHGGSGSLRGRTTRRGLLDCCPSGEAYTLFGDTRVDSEEAACANTRAMKPHVGRGGYHTRVRAAVDHSSYHPPTQKAYPAGQRARAEIRLR